MPECFGVYNCYYENVYNMTITERKEEFIIQALAKAISKMEAVFTEDYTLCSVNWCNKKSHERAKYNRTGCSPVIVILEGY